MSLPRRFLPPLSWLMAFESVARLGSVTGAATELDLTQSAVSRQIAKLEDQVGTALFTRDRKRLLPTTAGRAYAEQVRAALSRIANATVQLHSNPDGGALNLAILPAIGTHWLAPRLPDFLARHPGVTVNLSTRMAPFDFSGERFHAAISFGTGIDAGRWLGTRTLPLMEEEVQPVLSPTLAHEGLRPNDLAEMPLLHLETRPKGWARWFAQHDVDAPDPRSGMHFDQFEAMLKAAEAGLGVALMPRFLAEGALARGTVVTLPGSTMTSLGTYALVWPETQDDYPPLRAFRDWLKSQI
ncbi:DNA-binding transcriptional regulator, LysR family [Salinihabitans flavidus]|uniref:DNA-binding transcriptional regulator, LysR family n=1 Tax=Salinihabitans flavidus TaxID=569882 RepID=A0A1H8RMF5_9RHOB|nr:LysR family transcriptional regulator [Salinihabitans flavidus]SEO67522.1 DNA-binding transcriptional regulator, LysR family [Salinihabitans flavidus]